MLLLSGCALLGANADPSPSLVPTDYIEFVERACDEAAGGMVEFTGRVRNTHPDRALELVRLRGTLYDEENAAVSSNWGLISSDRLAPGGRSDFRFYIDDAPGAARCSVVVVSAEFTR